MVKVRQRADGRKEIRETIDGVRRSFYGKTSKEVRQKYRDALTTPKEEAPEFEPSAITVGDFFCQYDEVARDTMKRRSLETHRCIARKHLLPSLAGIKLAELDRERVQKLYSRKRDAGLSPARIRRIHGVLSSALNTAVRWRYVEHNVCREVSPPRVPAPDIRPLSKEEAKRLLEAAEQDRYHALITLGLMSGARWGELTALTWNRLDLENRTMQITRTLVKGKGGYSFEDCKTKGSRRTVALGQRAIDALLSHRERQRAAGHPVAGDALVFTNTVGNPVNHSHFRRNIFKPLLRRAELPDTTFHAATRHTCTCILLLSGVNPKSVAMQGGWSSVAFMLENYARFLPHWNDGGAMDTALS